MNRSSVERFLPVAYMALAMMLIVVLLPTALRPPEPPPPSSAEFSPDAPPDEDMEIVLSEFQTATSRTTGAGLEGLAEEAIEEVPLPDDVELRPRSRPCFGNPPRQTESLYAPPCAPVWMGDNGGPTHRGVTATEVTIALIRNSNDAYEGYLDQQDPEEESNQDRTYRVWQDYFNEHFELYGRRMRFVAVNAGDYGWQEGSQARNAITKADLEYHVFGVIVSGLTPPAEDEALRRNLVLFGGGANPLDYYQKHAPYAWSFKIDAEKIFRLSMEMVCKQMHGKPVEFTHDDAKVGQERVYGLIAYNDASHYGIIDGFRREFSRQCGGSFETEREYNLDDQSDAITSIITRMRADGVTTIVCGCDPVTPALFTLAANQQSYYPEWVAPGVPGMDLNGVAALYDNQQWQNAIGITSLEMAGARPSGSEGYRAYKAMDPNREPAAVGTSSPTFGELLQYAAGIQQAGPTLTPHNFQDGLQLRWPKREPDPPWSYGGGYEPGDWTYPDYVSLIWWDPDAPRPESSGARGAYRHLYGGQKFTFGQIPTERAPFFDRDQGIFAPPPEQRM